MLGVGWFDRVAGEAEGLLFGFGRERWAWAGERKLFCWKEFMLCC